MNNYQKKDLYEWIHYKTDKKLIYKWLIIFMDEKFHEQS